VVLACHPIDQSMRTVEVRKKKVVLAWPVPVYTPFPASTPSSLINVCAPGVDDGVVLART
jgi:hypothetical protein